VADAMGKGLSASITTTVTATFINELLTVSKDDFDLQKFVKNFLEYIQKYLFESEILSIVFCHIDTNNDLHYMNYAMPKILLQRNGLIESLPSNNPPIMDFVATSHINTTSLENIEKIFVRSDGIDERELKNSNNIIGSIIEETLLETNFASNIESKIEKNSKEQTDDATFVFLHKLNSFKETSLAKSATKAGIETLQENIEDIIFKYITNQASQIKYSMILTEALQNALEHGSLDIDFDEKDMLINNNQLEQLIENGSSKHIKVTVGTKQHQNKSILKISIKDEGEGFDVTSFLQKIVFKDEFKYNGRGILMALQTCEGVFFNKQGNEITIFIGVQNDN
jgi:anti-sigma regulatory factor (Ser/Thr protein kinase)